MRIGGARQAVREAVNTLLGRINLQETYEAVFETPQGQQVLKHLCKTYRVHKSAFAPGQPDMTAYMNGQRDVIIAILRQINKDTTKLIQQIEENTRDE